MHDDCIQLFTDTDITIKGNYLEQNNNKTSNAQGMMADALSGTTKIHNNIVNLRNATSGTLNLLDYIGNDDVVVEIFGNTLFAKHPYALLDLQDLDNAVVKNNILVVSENSTAPLEMVTRYQSSITYNPSDVSNNLLWNPNTSYIARMYEKGANISLTKAELEARRINLGGLNEDPRFRNPENRDFTPLNPKVCTASDTGSYIGALPCN